MIRWLLLSSLVCLSTQDGTAQETGVLQCRPLNTTLTGSDQTIALTWDDDSSCFPVHDVLIYELVVLIADEQVHYDEVAVTPDHLGSRHSWSWTSDWAWQCVSHSVRLSSRYKLQTSPWNLELTLPGVESSTRPGVYPKDRVYEVGSNASFCCVLSEDQIFDQMYLSEYGNSSIISTVQISNQTYGVTVHLDQPSTTTCNNVMCKARSQDGVTESGACVTIGYPPGDKDLQCETRDLESIDCHWTVGRDTQLIGYSTTYYLNGSHCADESPGRCSQKVKVDVGEQNWTLTAQNKLGTVELSDRADMTKRVHMFPPEGVTASSVSARTVRLKWGWKLSQYNKLNITCQVNVSDGTTKTMSESSGLGLNSSLLTDLIPNWSYSVSVRCGTAQHFWKWSDWSSRFDFHTKGDVPDALDVWMQTEDNHVIIIWKMLLANQSHGDITDYEVSWTKTTETDRENRITVPNTQHEHKISVNTTEEHLVTVTARNNNGSSPPSTITVPIYGPDTTRVNTSRISGINGSFSLSWSASPIASCGYTVDWCPSSGQGSVQWIRVPPHETNATIFSEDLKDGVRYLLSIYACTRGAPVLLERREGYICEKNLQDKLLKAKCKMQDSNLEVSWDPLPLSEQTAFIRGYVLYVSDNHTITSSVITDDPEATTLTARNLKIRSYLFSVKALTDVGEGGTGSCSATLVPQTDELIKAVIISLLTVSLLLPLITMVCYRHWGCIKQKVYPPIPKPLLSDAWLTSPGERSCRPLYMEVCPHSEAADFMDIPELQSKLGAPVKDWVSHEKTPFVYTQTPKGYYNKPLKICTPPPLLLPTTTDPSQSVLPRSPLRSVFPNLSYDLILQTGDQQCGPGPEQLEVAPDGYQPQINTETFTLDQTEEVSLSPMTCVSMYISLPQWPSQ